MDYHFISITDTKRCPCGITFVPITEAQVYHDSRCQQSYEDKRKINKRRAVTMEHKLNFVGIDGEGINVIHSDGTHSHRYVMLSIGDHTLWRDGRELSYTDVFPFLYSIYERQPASVYVGFYLGYDFTMWLKDLPEHEARMLFSKEGKSIRKPKTRKNPTPFPVYITEVPGKYHTYEVDMLGMKRFKIRPHVCEGIDQCKNCHQSMRVPSQNPKRYGWMYINDAGPFFQASFLTVIEPTDAKWPNGTKPCTEEEYATILEGKQKRADKTRENDISYYDDMVKYNRLENRILANCMAVLNEGFVTAGVRLNRSQWYGPGQAIQKWLDNQVRRQDRFLTREQVESVTPPEVIEAFINAYTGGWFETFYHGHLPGYTYEYDIISAYPDAMRMLPCLCSGNWTHGTGDNIDDIPKSTDILLVELAVIGSHPSMGGLQWRTRKGSILHPNNAAGWYLWFEIEAAQDAGLIDEMKIFNWIAFKRTCKHKPPLVELATLFETRQAVGKATPLGKALKLLFNSAYGKFAQSIGQPRYGNPIYATMITSECRTRILEAIATHPNGADDVVMVATDGVYFRHRHPNLELSSELGGWEMTRRKNMTLFKPGVYWDDKVRAEFEHWQNNKATKLSIKSRGIGAAVLAENIPRIDEAFTRVHDTGNWDDMPAIQVKIPFTVISPILALHRGKWETAGDVHYLDVREESVSVKPKRTNLYLDGRYIRSHPMDVPVAVASTPYPKRFGYLERELAREEFGYTPEGHVQDVVSFALHAVQ